MVDSNAGPSPTLEAQAVDAVERHLRQGEPLLAYNAVQEGLAAWPQNSAYRLLWPFDETLCGWGSTMSRVNPVEMRHRPSS